MGKGRLGGLWKRFRSGVPGLKPIKNEFDALYRVQSCQKANGDDHFEYSEVNE